jgi:hypothetical protein
MSLCDARAEAVFLPQLSVFDQTNRLIPHARVRVGRPSRGCEPLCRNIPPHVRFPMGKR